MDMISPNPLAYKAKTGNTIKSEKIQDRYYGALFFIVLLPKNTYPMRKRDCVSTSDILIRQKKDVYSNFQFLGKITAKTMRTHTPLYTPYKITPF